MHYLQEAMQSVQVITSENEKKIAFYDPLKEIKTPDRDLRKCITDYILDEWHTRCDDNYMKVEVLNRLFSEQKDYNNENTGVVLRIDSNVKNIMSEYILADTVESILTGYAEKDTVDEMRQQMKKMPTLSALDLRLKMVDDQI